MLPTRMPRSVEHVRGMHRAHRCTTRVEARDLRPCPAATRKASPPQLAHGHLVHQRRGRSSNYSPTHRYHEVLVGALDLSGQATSCAYQRAEAIRNRERGKSIHTSTAASSLDMVRYETHVHAFLPTRAMPLQQWPASMRCAHLEHCKPYLPSYCSRSRPCSPEGKARIVDDVWPELCVCKKWKRVCNMLRPDHF